MLVSETLQSLEKNILELLPRFPNPLQHDLQGFVARLPGPNTKEAMMPSVSQRLQAVVGAKDYDKDGAVDILLQHSTTGVAKIVYFDTAGTELSEKEIGTVDTTTLWEIRN